MQSIRPWLLVAPSLSHPPGPIDPSVRCLAEADVPADLHTLCDVAEAVNADELLLALDSALPLAAALIMVRERVTLRSVLDQLVKAGCDVLSLTESIAAALIHVELQVRGEASDLMEIPGAPASWTWLSWRSGSDSITVVSRGRDIHARRLRPEPRMA